MKQKARTAKQIGAIIRRARRHADLTQAQLAGKIGLRQATVSRLERGEDETNLGTLLDALAALGLEIIIDERGKASLEDLGTLF